MPAGAQGEPCRLRSGGLVAPERKWWPKGVSEDAENCWSEPTPAREPPPARKQEAAPCRCCSQNLMLGSGPPPRCLYLGPARSGTGRRGHRPWRVLALCHQLSVQLKTTLPPSGCWPLSPPPHTPLPALVLTCSTHGACGAWPEPAPALPPLSVKAPDLSGQLGQAPEASSHPKRAWSFTPAGGPPSSPSPGPVPGPMFSTRAQTPSPPPGYISLKGHHQVPSSGPGRGGVSRASAAARSASEGPAAETGLGGHAESPRSQDPVSTPNPQTQVSAAGASPAGIGRRGPGPRVAAGSRPPFPGPWRRRGARGAAALAVQRAGLGRHRPLAAGTEGRRHGHQVGGAGRQALQSGAVAARGHVHSLRRAAAQRAELHVVAESCGRAQRRGPTHAQTARLDVRDDDALRPGLFCGGGGGGERL